MTKTETVLVRMDQSQLAALDCLADIVKANRSSVLRGLIPPVAIAEAMVDLQRLQGMSGRFAAEDFFTLFSLNVLAGWMRHDKNNPVEYQLDSACSGTDPELKVAVLFQKWSRAKRNIRGYYFARITYQDKFFNVVFEPDDTREKIEVLRAEVLSYAEKLYSPMKPLEF